MLFVWLHISWSIVFSNIIYYNLWWMLLLWLVTYMYIDGTFCKSLRCNFFFWEGNHGKLLLRYSSTSAKQAQSNIIYFLYCSWVMWWDGHICKLVKWSLSEILPVEQSVCTIMCGLAIESNDWGNNNYNGKHFQVYYWSLNKCEYYYEFYRKTERGSKEPSSQTAQLTITSGISAEAVNTSDKRKIGSTMESFSLR